MDKVTTEDCRAFLADFHKKNPQIIGAVFGSDLVQWKENTGHDIEPEEKLLFLKLYEPKSWKRTYKKSVQSDEISSRNRNGTFSYYQDGEKVNSYGESSSTMSADKVANVRGFQFSEFDGQVAYELIETVDGKLFLGNYIGD